MNKNDLERKWNELRWKIQEKWHKLTDTDISEIDGEYDQFMKKIQHRYGYSKEQAQKEFQNWNHESSGMNYKGEHGKKEEGQEWNREGRGMQSQRGDYSDRESEEGQKFDREEGNMRGQKNWEEGSEERKSNQGKKHEEYRPEKHGKEKGHGKQPNGWKEGGEGKKRKAS